MRKPTVLVLIVAIVAAAFAGFLAGRAWPGPEARLAQAVIDAERADEECKKSITAEVMPQREAAMAMARQRLASDRKAAGLGGG